MSLLTFLYLFIYLVPRFSFQNYTKAKEFEENRITSNNELFTFKTYNKGNLVLIITNENLPEDANIGRKFIIYSSKNTMSNEYNLESFYCYYDSLSFSEESIEYTIRFNNYKGGYFLIYNSYKDFPLKQFQKGFNFFQSSYHIKLSFISDILDDDVFIYIYKGFDFKMTKVTNNTEERITFIRDSLLLNKGSKYRLVYDPSFEMNAVIKKREIIDYKINDEVKIQLYYSLPIYILFNLEDYNDKIFCYLSHNTKFNYNYQIANLDNKTIVWDKLVFSKTYKSSTEEVFEIVRNNYDKKYILIKIDLDLAHFSIKFYEKHFGIFKIFQEYYKQSYANTHPKIISNEALYLMSSYYYSSLLIVFSNIKNIRTLKNKETKNFIYDYNFENFKFIISQSKTDYQLNQIVFYPEINYRANISAKILTDDFSYHNSFKESFERNLYIFDINKKTTLSIKSEVGNIKMYYTDIINYEIFSKINKNDTSSLKVLNSGDIKRFSSPFALYMLSFDKNYISIIVNKDENLIINNGISSKFLIENKAYQLSLLNDILIKIDNDFNLNINIYKDKNKIFTLNKGNPYIKLNSAYGNITLISEKNTSIHFYYKISYLYLYENPQIIEFDKNKKGQILVAKYRNSYSPFFKYFSSYGIDNYTTPDIITKEAPKYFIIEDPYSELNYKDETLKYYIIILHTFIDYKEISYYKKFEKENNKYYYTIKGNEKLAFLINSGHRYQLFKCSNQKIDINITTNDNNQIYERNYSGFLDFNPGTLLNFKSNSEFIFLETKETSYSKLELKYFIPKIENNAISVVIYNHFLPDTNYTIIIVEDKNKDDNLIKRLDNECYLISLIENRENKYKDLNYEIRFLSDTKSKIIYEEIKYSKFSSKYLLIKVFTCIEKLNLCLFPPTQRIFLENIKKEESQKSQEFGITKIKELTQYNITRKEFMFEYDYLSYLSFLDDIIIYIYYPAMLREKGKLEVINPSFQRFVFEFSENDVIYLKRDIHVTSNGKYYLIFNAKLGTSFYIHNMLRFFSLNSINNFETTVRNNTLSNGGFQIFNFDIESDRYIFTYFYNKQVALFLYSIKNKIDIDISNSLNGYTKIVKGSYIFVVDYSNPSYSISDLKLSINHNIFNLELNHETISYRNNFGVFVDLSKYNKDIYLVFDGEIHGHFKCFNSLTNEEIIKNDFVYSDPNYIYTNTYIQKLSQCTKTECNPPYYGFQPYTSRFELVDNFYTIDKSQNLKFKQNDTIVFQFNKFNFYILIISNLENLKSIDQSETEFVDIIFKNEKISFKLKPNDKIETNLKINILEDKYNIQIESLTSNEISSRINYKTSKAEVKYYINLSKNKIIINHFDYDGNIEYYLSKENINENNLKKILDNKEINMDLFELITKETFEVNPNKIIAYIMKNNTFSDILMSPEIHSFMIENTSYTKFLRANRRYIIDTYLKILLEENSNANIVVTDTNNKLIYTINKNNPILENKIYTDKPLFLNSDKDVLIFIYHHIKSNQRNIIFPKNGDGKLILFKDDCYAKMNYLLGLGFENYIPFDLTLKDMEQTYLIFNTNIEHKKIPKGLEYFLHFECSIYVERHYSGYYIDSDLKEGYNYYIDENKPIKFNIEIDKLKKNIFYQSVNCDSGSANYFHASIDKNDLKNIGRDAIVEANNNISFYLPGIESFFNYQRTNSSLKDYENLDKDIISPSFSIKSFNGKKMVFELTTKYKDVDFDFYVIVYLEKIRRSNVPLKNICYWKKLIEKNESFNDENIIIQKISYKNKVLSNNSIDIPKIKNNTYIYSNVYGSGKILDDIKEYVFYTEQEYYYTTNKRDTVPDSDSGSDSGESETGKTSLSIGAIIGIAIGGVVLVLIIIFFILRLRKKNSHDLEEAGIPLNLSKLEKNN